MRPPVLPRHFACFAGFVLLLLAVCADGADITAALDTANLRLRLDAPIPLDVRFQNPTPRLIEGRLEFTLLLGDRKAGVHRTAEIVLQPGTQTVPVLLPPPMDANPGDGIAARLRWLGADGAQNLGDQRIGIYGIGTEVVLGIVRTERRLTELDHARDNSLKLEFLRPALDAASWLSITTHHAPVARERLPVHPTGLCAYDAVFFDGPAFAAASEKQLTALARWVEAGGSVGISAEGQLEERHLAFLERLGASQFPAVRRARDLDGALTLGGTAAAGRGPAIALLRPELGRALVTDRVAIDPKDFDHNEWRAGVAWLWKLRESEQREVARTGRWSKNFLRMARGRSGSNDVELQSLWGAANGFDWLKSDAPRQMPLSVVALVLGALLVVAGPADWFALGWLRRRRWTWIAFPIACAACGWWTAHLAGKYIGVGDRNGRVRIVDVAHDGRPLRETRYEMLLPARDREWEHDVRDGIALPVSRAQSVWSPNSRPIPPIPGLPPAPYSFTGGAGFDADGATEWPSAGHFILRRALRQWSPAMVRVTSFPASLNGAQPDWDAALAHFAANNASENWNPGTAAGGNFQFAVPNPNRGDGEPYSPGYPRAPNWQIRHGGPEPDPSDVDLSFARWVAFGNNWRNLGGLGTAISPVLAGTSDLVRGMDSPPDRRVLCAWRRADGELLIYRRSLPVK